MSDKEIREMIEKKIEKAGWIVGENGECRPKPSK